MWPSGISSYTLPGNAKLNLRLLFRLTENGKCADWILTGKRYLRRLTNHALRVSHEKGYYP